MPKIPIFKWSADDELFGKLGDDALTTIDNLFRPKGKEDLRDLWHGEDKYDLLPDTGQAVENTFDKIKDWVNGDDDYVVSDSLRNQLSPESQEIFKPFLENNFDTPTLDYIDSISDGGSEISFQGYDFENIPIGIEDIGSDFTDIVDTSELASFTNLVDITDLFDISDLIDVPEPINLIVGTLATIGTGLLYRRSHKRKANRIDELKNGIKVKCQFVNCIKNNQPPKSALAFYKELKKQGEL